jgi:glycosyltransferase involved in cell wall biosynthesis
MNDLLRAGKIYKANGWKAVHRFIKERNRAHAEVLSIDPNVILITANRNRDDLHRRLKDIDLLLLLRFSWAVSLDDVCCIALQVKAELQGYPNHRISLLCNEEWQVNEFCRHGVESLFVNSNAFVNEHIFKPGEHSVLHYDAVYNAAMAPYKRYELAAKISSLMIITYRYDQSAPAYELEIRRLLGSAYWANDSRTDQGKIPVDELPSLYDRCGVGLCLSEVEGQMLASIEYLLCGLPIVSTASIGGRDVFFDARYVRIVHADQASVAEAVTELKSLRIDRHMIREETLKLIASHRQRLLQFLKHHGAQVSIPWRPGSHGALTFRKYSEIERLVRAKKLSISYLLP